MSKDEDALTKVVLSEQTLPATMKPRVSAYIAASVDGFIARKDGNLDWLDAWNSVVPDGEDCGYGAFMKDIDVLVMGRKTYEKVLTHPTWPYGKKRMLVLSSKTIKFPKKVPNTVSHSRECPSHLCRRLGGEGVRRIYIDGGVTIQRFLAAGLVDDLIITTIPILIGEGTPLFGTLPGDVQLKCAKTKTYKFGFVQVHYQVIRNDSG